MEPVILHIETSSRLCSVALSTGPELLGTAQSAKDNDHSSILVPLIRELLLTHQVKFTDLSAVAVSIGPGSYTGLRVGLSTAKAICYVAGKPLIAVDTLQSLAWTSADKAGDSEIVYLAVLDARRQDAYTALYDQKGVRLQEDQFITADAAVLGHFGVPGKGMMICGEGTEKWLDIAKTRPNIQVSPLECHARNLVRSAWEAFQTGKYAELSACVPKYLKPPNITKPR